MTAQQPSGADLQAQLDQVRQDRERSDRQLAEIASQKAQLVDTQALIDQEATALEERIRQLAKEEAEIQRRKRAIQEEAKGIGRKRRELMDRSQELVAEEGRLGQAIGELQQREASLQAALQAEQDAAAVERARQAAAAPPPAAQPAPQPAAPQPAAPQAAAPAPAQASGPDQRSSKRIAVAVDVSMETPHNFYMGLTENLSEGGLFVATYDEVPLGTELELRLSLPGSPPIKTRGIVRWIREHTQFTEDVVPGVGLEMVDLSEEDTQAIRRFLAERDPIYYEKIDAP